MNYENELIADAIRLALHVQGWVEDPNGHLRMNREDGRNLRVFFGKSSITVDLSRRRERREKLAVAPYANCVVDADNHVVIGKFSLEEYSNVILSHKRIAHCKEARETSRRDGKAWSSHNHPNGSPGDECQAGRPEGVDANVDASVPANGL